MTLDEYQLLSRRTLKPYSEYAEALEDYSLGILTEAGEAFDIVKKHLFHGHVLDRDALEKECGDIMWYVAACCSTLGIKMGEAVEFSLIPVTGKPLIWYVKKYFQEATLFDSIAATALQTGSTSRLLAAQRTAGNLIQCIHGVCVLTGISFESVLARNVEKLKARYPQGYSDQASVERNFSA